MLKKTDSASFVYCMGYDFFLTTEYGNYTWSDPDYGGDNTITPYSGSWEDYVEAVGCSSHKYKGKHVIQDYCGESVVIKE